VSFTPVIVIRIINPPIYSSILSLKNINYHNFILFSNICQSKRRIFIIFMLVK